MNCIGNSDIVELIFLAISVPAVCYQCYVLGHVRGSNSALKKMMEIKK